RTAYFWRANVGPYSLPKDLEVVVDASPRYWNGEVIWDIDGIEPARLSRRVQLSGGLSVLPRWLLKLASHPETVRRLWAHLHLLQNRCLREFALRVFQDPDLAVPFVISPASRDHHHQEPGGLLQHSLECMIQLPKIAGLAQDEWEVARIAVLFHDIGKIHMAYGQTRGSAEGVLSRHDDATLEVLAPHLAWLRAQDADLLAALKHHLLWHPRLGRPWMPGVLLVRCLDQISAALDARRRAFGDRPRKTQYARLAVRGPENRFWRLASPGGTGMHGEDSA
ncbi:MAG: HD domain-containing protein, partial [Chloroflexi bacterium]